MNGGRETVAVLGLGVMGSVLAGALLEGGHDVTVWNRTPGRDAALVERGARRAGDALDAVRAAPVVVVCLYDHASVHETLDPLAEQLRGRVVVNLTTTTPNEARDLAAWAAEHGVRYLDGAIMATPPMIGTPGAAILYSGDEGVFGEVRGLLDVWATSTFEGTDPGRASLLDLAMLSGMYTMFAAFLHGAAMVGADGVSAGDYARRAAPFLAAMTEMFALDAEVIDSGDYSDPVQSLDWSDLGHLVRASEEQGVDPAPIAMVEQLRRRQVDAGHGAQGFARIYEGLRRR
ncbi:NAD(P)-binding domain-containing protein [Isoptericola sp. 4D.3]|uniref:NAD(P)-binding domain-containing protein n=1 Tax=Isoptericola peretonis TaxID=2918523 RepID=A0ABT0J8H2_9MICO|nr:NAD(P)-binding domain-containing protein [Isoptericola sp. 4D.3]